MAITTVHLDRHGYVVEVFHDTRSVQLDAGKYAGTLMDVTGPIAPGMRWDGQTFVLPPPRIPPEAVLNEKARRSAMFPERFVKQITALGGDNAMRVSKYLGELHNTAERMMLGDPPADFKDDKHWPTVPELHDLPLAQRLHDVSPVSPVSGQPINIHVAPVINTTPQAAQAPAPLIVHAKSETVQPSFTLDPSDPLYLHKLAFIRSLDEYDKVRGIPHAVEPLVTDAALKVTMAKRLEDIETHKLRVKELLEAA